MGSLQSILAELRRRQVFRAAGIYVVAAWAAVQVFSLVFPAIDVPDAAIRYVWLIVLLLFPLALVFAWFYELTTSGIKRAVPLATTEHSYLSLRSVDRIILAALALVGVVITWQMSGSIREVAQTGNIAVNLDADPKSIAVLPLSNVSGDSEQQ